MLGEFKSYYGPTMNAFEAAGADGRETDLEAELETLFDEQNSNGDSQRRYPQPSRASRSI